MLDTIVLYTRQVVLMPGLNYLEYDLSAATPPDNWKAADNGVWVSAAWGVFCPSPVQTEWRHNQLNLN